MLTRLVSRRSFLFGSAALVVVGVAGVQPTPAEGVPGAESAATAGLAVIDPSNPVHSTTLANKFPGLTASVGFRALQNSAHILVNQSEQSIWACSLAWSVPAKDGSRSTWHSHYFSNSSSHLGLGHKRRRLLTGRMEIIPPGEVVVATPLFLATPRTYAKFIKRHGSADALFTIAVNKNPRLADRLLTTQGQPVVPSSGALIFQGGKISEATDMGAAQGLKRHFHHKRRAEQAEAASLLKHIQSGATEQSLMRKLDKHSARPLKKTVTRHEHIYGLSRRAYASHVLRYLKQNGVARTTTLLQKVVSLKQYKAA